MNRDQILTDVRELFTDVGFCLSEPLPMKSISFDLVARRDNELMIVKILQNVDSLSRKDAQQMMTLAEALGGRAIVVGLRSSSGKLEEGIIYSRFSVAILSFETLRELLKEGVPPFVFAAPGGLYVRMDGELLRRLRSERNISLGALAEIAGVSRKAIQMYEEGMGAVVEVAMRIEEFLNVPLVLPLDPFVSKREVGAALDPAEERDLFHEDVFRILEDIGYTVLPIARCPFEAITTDEQILLLTGVEEYGPALERKVKAVSSISRVVEKKAMIITDRRVRLKSILHTPLICRDELMKMDDRRRMIDMIRERS